MASPNPVVEALLGCLVDVYRDAYEAAEGQSGGPESEAEGALMEALCRVEMVLTVHNVKTEGAAKVYRAMRGIFLPEVVIDPSHKPPPNP